MVSIDPSSLLTSRLYALDKVIAASRPDAGSASRGFAERLQSYLTPDPAKVAEHYLSSSLSEAAYGGVPDLALAGYRAGSSTTINSEEIEHYLQLVSRLRGRPQAGQAQLVSDDIAILGIADGLSRIRLTGLIPQLETTWLTEIADGSYSGSTWTRRLRMLAADLLDGRGRMRIDAPSTDVDAFALDLCLRKVWPTVFSNIGYPSRDAQQALIAKLLIEPLPMEGELERAIVWRMAATILAFDSAIELVPTVDRVVGMLSRSQGALKRWVWEERQGRSAQWLINEEAHVQAFLWAMLYPAIGDQLRDEQYLPGFGLKQPRYDFGIVNLRLIIEVKVIRSESDFKKVEEEITGDLGLYFSDPGRFNQLIAYIYDDSDAHHPERYESLRNALRLRDERVIDVVIVRRPGMMPSRKDRKMG